MAMKQFTRNLSRISQAAGLFVISAFMGTATGSSMGTVTAVIPIAVGIAEKGGLSLTAARRAGP